MLLPRYLVPQFLLLWGLSLVCNASLTAAERLFNFREPPHSYFEHKPNDRLAKLHLQLAAGEVSIDTSSDRSFLVTMLKALEVPESSQILVFSATSLQSEIINPRNPRALYFNDDTYVGWVPGGRLEVAAIDPDMGPMFYVYEKVTPGRIPTPERSTRCFACHAGTATNYVPGLIAESVLVSMAGSSLQTFRHDVQGHQIPLEKRFGGWLLTGKHNLTKHEANLAGQSDAGKITRFDAGPGKFSDLSLHLRPTSDILPHLVHEHQMGFENRLFQASYLLRHRLHEGNGHLKPEAEQEIDTLLADLARYILFADEAPFPPRGIEGDHDFIRDFQESQIRTGAGQSLKEFDLRTRLFKYRCTFMLYTDSWKHAPQLIKDKVYLQMAQGLKDSGNPKEMAHLPLAERHAIRSILKETLPDLPIWWR
jgi:hypothetical protein